MSDRVRLLVGTDLLPAAAVDELRTLLPAIDLDVAPVPWADGALPDLDPWLPLIAHADVIVGFAQHFPDPGRIAPRLKWIQHFGAGYETVDVAALRHAGVGLASAAGAGAASIAEFVMMAMLSMVRRGDELHSAQRQHLWRTVPSEELGGRRLTVIGAGAIGTRVIALGHAFGMRVHCVRREPRKGCPAGADAVSGSDRLDDVLSATDVLVLAAPLTEATRTLIGPAQIAALRPGALLVNVARAGLLDHDALVAALTDGRMRGAWLDVVPDEPLPADAPLWDVPNLWISPHSAVATLTYPRRMVRHTAVAVDAWLAGAEVPHTVVDIPALKGLSCQKNS